MNIIRRPFKAIPWLFGMFVCLSTAGRLAAADTPPAAAPPKTPPGTYHITPPTQPAAAPPKTPAATKEAQPKGQPDLDAAIAAKVTADTLQEYAKVIELCDRAIV